MHRQLTYYPMTQSLLLRQVHYMTYLSACTLYVCTELCIPLRVLTSASAAIKACLSQLLNCNHTLDFYLYCLVSKSWRAKFCAWLRSFPCWTRVPATGASCVAGATTRIGPLSRGGVVAGGSPLGSGSSGGGLGGGGRGGAKVGKKRPSSHPAFGTAPFAAAAPNEAPPPVSEATLVSIGGTDKVVPTDGNNGVQLRLVIHRKQSDMPDKCFTTPVLKELAENSPTRTENQQQLEMIVADDGFPSVDGQVEKLADGKN